jgi:O2-independent ubiquinone biosynthesis protein UbiU
VWRQALDACAQDRAAFGIQPRWTEALRKLSEGSQCTLGAYHRPWK